MRTAWCARCKAQVWVRDIQYRQRATGNITRLNKCTICHHKFVRGEGE